VRSLSSRKPSRCSMLRAENVHVGCISQASPTYRAPLSRHDPDWGTILQGRNGPFSFERGIDVRVDAIEWVCTHRTGVSCYD
jgi:hypothetical protein